MSSRTEMAASSNAIRFADASGIRTCSPVAGGLMAPPAMAIPGTGERQITSNRKPNMAAAKERTETPNAVLKCVAELHSS